MTTTRPTPTLTNTLHRAQQALDARLTHALEGEGITPRQYLVLVALAECAEPSHHTLVGATNIDRSTMTDICRQLVKRGLVTQRRSRRDARAYVVKLTSQGAQCLVAAQRAVQRVERDLTDPELLASLTGLIARARGTETQLAEAAE